MGCIKKFGRNIKGKDFVCGDLHGCYTKLMQALREISFDREVDRLFCCGDLVDRGPDSVKCMSLVYEPWFFSVRGNHELLMYNGLYGTDNSLLGLWLYNGGSWIYEEDHHNVRLIADDVLTKMPFAMEIETEAGSVGIIHAEVPNNDWSVLSDKGFDEEHCVWARTRIKVGDKSLVENIDKVYVGHSIVKEPVVLGNVQYIDTGAFLEDGYLTIVEI